MLKAHSNKRSFYKKLTCWVVSLALVFSTVSTPAYASEAASSDVAPVSSQVAPSDLQSQEDLSNPGDEQQGDPEVIPGEGGDDSGILPPPDVPVPPEDTPTTVDLGNPQVALTSTLYGPDGMEKPEGSYAEAGDVIQYTVKITDLNQDARNALSSLIDTRSCLSLDDGFYDPDAACFEVSGSYTVTGADANAGEALFNHVTVSIDGLIDALEADDGGISTVPAPEDLYTSYSVDITCVVKDWLGDPRGEEVLAVPSDVVDYSFTITNDGTLPLQNMIILPTTDRLAMVGDWTLSYLAPGESITFEGRYVVSEEDVAAEDASELQFVEAGISVAYGEGEEPEIFNHQAVKVVNKQSYTINYFMLDADGVTTIPIKTVKPLATLNTEKMLDYDELNAYVPKGYKPLAAGTVDPIIISENTDDNVFNVVYEPDVFTYTIKYYQDSMQNEPLGTVEGSAPYGSSITVAQGNEPGQINYMCPRGYLEREDTITQTITADNDQVISVVYTDKKSYAYSIEYYLGDTGESLGRVELGQAQYGDDVSLNSTALLNYRWQEGYIALTAADAKSAFVHITDDPEQNVYQVVYQPDSFGYTINYYVIDNNYEGNRKLIGSTTERAVFGTTVTLTAADLNAKLAEIGPGYQGKPEDSTAEILITADETKNVYDVVYDRAWLDCTITYYTDSVSPENAFKTETVSQQFGLQVRISHAVLEKLAPTGYEAPEGSITHVVKADPADNQISIVYSKQGNLPYVIRYYKDSIDESNYLNSYPGSGTFGDVIPVNATLYAPSGYVVPGEVSGATTIGTTLEDSVVNVVYRKAEYAYTVNYYVDEVNPDNLIESVPGTGAFNSYIPYDIDGHLPDGYTTENAALSGALQVGVVEDENVLNVVYSQKAQLSYTVNYYMGSLDGTKRSFTGTGVFGDDIPYSIGMYLEPGYTTEGVQVFKQSDTITMDSSANVIDIVYPAASFGYTVNYYKGSVQEGNLIASVHDVGLFGSVIPYELGYELPAGYTTQNAIVPNDQRISFDEANNVVNIVYQPDRFAYTINFYRGSIAPNNLIQSVSPEPRLFGSTVQMGIDELNYYCPEGYSKLTQGIEVYITEDSERNVANVVFYPDFEAFYTAGIAPLNATYTGAKQYLAPSGVIKGDIITYMYNGAQQTRVVDDLDVSSIGAEFQDVTDGEIPVAITVTRAGITSNALQASVNISPAPEVDETDNGILFDLPDDLAGLVSTIGPAIAQAIDIMSPEQAYASELDPGFNGFETIEDDANPLAGFNTMSSQATGPAQVTYLLLMLSGLCILALVVLYAIRRRMCIRIEKLRVRETVIDRDRVRYVSYACAAVSFAAAAFYILWVIFLI